MRASWQPTRPHILLFFDRGNLLHAIDSPSSTCIPTSTALRECFTIPPPRPHVLGNGSFLPDLPFLIMPTPATSILELGDAFYDPVEPAVFPEHRLRFRNQRAAKTIGIDTLNDATWIEHLGRFSPLPNNLTQPLALRYHGHQFRAYNPNLGDGRGFLFAQFLDDQGRLLDLGTKGTGRTPYSRGGDGRLTLKGAVREILAAELLQARGVPTCKILSVSETGEALQRHDEPSPTRAAALVRLSHSHIRIGMFQRLAYHDERDNIVKLGRYCAQHYYPELVDQEDGPLLEGLLREVLHALARTAAGWMAAGFVHGVLNTDNMNITGESFDYGPWRFLPHVDARFTAAYFDETGLYAYGRQPQAVHWNLTRLAECFFPWSSGPRLTAILDEFQPLIFDGWQRQLFKLLGVQHNNPAQNRTTFAAAMQFLETHPIPYDQFLFDWYGGVEASENAVIKSPIASRYQGDDFEQFRHAFSQHPPLKPRPREHVYFNEDRPASAHIDEVERIWAAIAENDDWTFLHDTIARYRDFGAILTSS